MLFRSGLGTMAIAIVGACIAVLSYFNGRDDEAVSAYEEEPEEEKPELQIQLKRSDLIKHWLIGLGAEVGYNYERMQASGNILAMVPIIRRLYHDPKDISDAMKRYLVFFNTEPSFIGNVIPGICASLEEQRANGEIGRAHV